MIPLHLHALISTELVKLKLIFKKKNLQDSNDYDDENNDDDDFFKNYF